ncbi:DUF3754 domain-containing protein [Halovulum sp. GXIMD14793]
MSVEPEITQSGAEQCVPDRDRFIPMSKAELVHALQERPDVTEEQQGAIGRLARWLSLLFHLSFFDQREALKDAFSVYDPDQPGDDPVEMSASDRAEFFDKLEPALIAANFRRLTDEELDQEKASRKGRVGALIAIPHQDYAEVRFYGRGRRESRFTIRRFFQEKEMEEHVYDYVVFCASTANPLPKNDRKSRLRPGALYLKLFRDIPQSDLSTLYPNAKVVMKLQDKLMLGVPALLGGIPILLNILPALTVLFIVLGAYLGISGTVEEDSMKKALAALSGLAALVGFLLRQWTKYERQSLRYQKQVLDNAYFNNINNNRGFFDFLIGASEDAEVKEALLAYQFLSEAGTPLTEEELDLRVEAWLMDQTGHDVDFEVDDALRKLHDLGLVDETEGKLSAIPQDAAEARCSDAWKDLAETMS